MEEVGAIDWASDGLPITINTPTRKFYRYDPETFALKFPLMQFTGVLDKNGKEIFEGDVVRGKWSINDIVEVKCDTLASGSVPFNDDYSFCADDVEVIGNIYENPEFLAEGK